MSTSETAGEKMLGNSAIDKLVVFVSDYKKALSFYKGILKLHPLWEIEEAGTAGFKVGYNLLILQQDKNEVKPGGIRINFTVRNVEKLREKLMKDKVVCEQMKVYRDYKWVDFTDEDGNRFRLMEPSEQHIEMMEELLERKLSLRQSE